MDLDPMLGVKTMLKIATCPTCGTKVKCKGEPGEKKLVICPNCNSRGVVKFEKKDKLKEFYFDKSSSDADILVVQITRNLANKILKKKSVGDRDAAICPTCNFI